MEVVRLREKSKTIGLTAKEALEEAINSPYASDEALIILYSKEKSCYQFWQGGSITNERMLWHVEKFKAAVLEGRMDELD